ETDPVLPQVEVANGNAFYIELLEAHTHHFTFAENLGAADCGVPLDRFNYRPTRQPIVLDWWTQGSSTSFQGGARLSDRFTTIASWRQTGKDFEWDGETYTWSKHHEFLKFIDLPRKTTERLELALALKGSKRERDGTWVLHDDGDAKAMELMKSHGWRIVDGLALSREVSSYRDYILGSRGEFTVAKDQNVRLRSGWFSDRSACYLAAGRPVVTQDTGFGRFLPTGEGLFAFSTMEDILAAFAAISRDYERHCRAARAIAERHLSAETVLQKLVDEIGFWP
ncbi:MAG TPA: hypothetical protein VNO43_07920, partial [Candidatus Eisenbacteria bacterium]|nr:hypothetical protein [Candidatus Eisenbacteria bacterium]